MEIKTTKQMREQMKAELNGHSQAPWSSLTKEQQAKIWRDSFANINEFIAVMNGVRVYNV